MGLKIFAIILLLFAAEITFLSTKQPKDLRVSTNDINYTTVAFYGLKGCKIDANGISEHLEASKALKFKTYDELYDLNTTFVKKDITHTLIAQKARYQNERLYLSGDVRYDNNKSMRIKSRELEYNTITKIVKSPVPFTLTSAKGTMVGDSFIYDMTNGKIKGEKMHYRLEVNDQ